MIKLIRLSKYIFLSFALVFCLRLAAKVPAPVVEPDTVALWNLGETHGRFVTQEVSGGIEMEMSKGGGVLIADQGINGLVFPGSFRVSSQGPDSALPLTSDVTVEVWLKITSSPVGTLAANRGIFQHMVYPKGGFRLRLNPNNRLEWGIMNGVSEKTLVTRLELPTDRWLHIAATYDSREMRIYIDGELEVQQKLSDGVITPPKNPYTLIGYSDPDEYFIGSIRAVRVSNTAMSFPQK